MLFQEGFVVFQTLDKVVQEFEMGFVLAALLLFFSGERVRGCMALLWCCRTRGKVEGRESERKQREAGWQRRCPKVHKKKNALFTLQTCHRCQ